MDNSTDWTAVLTLQSRKPKAADFWRVTYIPRDMGRSDLVEVRSQLAAPHESKVL